MKLNLVKLPLIPHFVGLALPFALLACTQSGDGMGSSSTDDTVTSLLNAVESTGTEDGEAEAVAGGQCAAPELGERARRHAMEDGMLPDDAANGDAQGMGRGRHGGGEGGGRGMHGGRDGGGRGMHGGEGGGRGMHGGRGGRHGGERVEHLLFIYDADGNGELDDAEKAELQDDLTARCEARQAALLAEFDADGDGTLSEEELAAARAAHKAERDARHAEMLAEFDADGDGELSREEHDAAHEARRSEAEAARAALEAEFDADGDGTLNDEELTALRAALREKIRSGEKPL